MGDQVFGHYRISQRILGAFLTLPFFPSSETSLRQSPAFNLDALSLSTVARHRRARTQGYQASLEAVFT